MRGRDQGHEAVPSSGSCGGWEVGNIIWILEQAGSVILTLPYEFMIMFFSPAFAMLSYLNVTVQCSFKVLCNEFYLVK